MAQKVPIADDYCSRNNNYLEKPAIVPRNKSVLHLQAKIAFHSKNVNHVSSLGLKKITAGRKIVNYTRERGVKSGNLCARQKPARRL